MTDTSKETKSDEKVDETKVEAKVEDTELTGALDKLNNHLSAMRRKDDVSPEALEQVDKHLARLEALKEVPAEEKQEKHTPTETEGDKTDDRIDALEKALAESQRETAVGKVVNEFGLSANELALINTDDVEELSKRAKLLKGMVANSQRQKAVSVPEDLAKNETANRLLNT